MTQDLAALPDGLKTRIGERGATLSGGQRQRVAIARALAGDPSFLVLDDVGAALDADTEAALWDGLARLRPGLTKVVATHRSATIERADRIVVLDRGKVADQGTHGELLGRCELYRELYARVGSRPRAESEPQRQRHELNSHRRHRSTPKRTLGLFSVCFGVFGG